MLQIKNNPILQNIIQSSNNNNSQKKEIQKDINKNNNASSPFMNNNVVTSQKTIVVKKTIKCMHDLTKTGFDGNVVKKNNQDNFFIYSNFLGIPDSYYIGVWYNYEL